MVMRTSVLLAGLSSVLAEFNVMTAVHVFNVVNYSVIAFYVVEKHSC
jgi:hypothetical protein